MLQYNPTVSGSLIITGSLTVTNGVIGTVSGVDIQIFSSSINQVITGIQVSTGSSDAKFQTLGGVTSSALTRLTNIETKSASVDISISNINSVTASNIARLSNLETKSSSVDISISNINSFTASNGNTSLNTYTGSNDTKFTTLATYTGSLDTKNTTLSSVTSSLISKTGSYATTGSNTFVGTTIMSGSTYVTGDFVVYGSSSIQYISASSVSIGTNIVQLNTNQPAVRFAGISVQDSGSAQGVTGSIFWDGLCNKWIYSNPSGVGYSGGMLMSGPRNTSSIGNEVGLTCNYVAKSGGGDHLYDSCIWEMSGSVGINTNVPGAALEVGGLGTNDGILLKSPASQPRLQFYTGGASANNKTWDFIPQNTGVLVGRVLNDAGDTASTWLSVTRSGASISSVVFNSGNIGIGTSCTIYPLTRNGMTIKASGNDGVEFVMLSCGDTSSTGGTMVRTGTDFGMINRTAGCLIFATNANERMWINSSGVACFACELTVKTLSGTTIYGSTAVCSPIGKFTTCLDLGGGLTGTNASFSSYLTAVAPSSIFYGMQIYGASGGARKIFVAGQQGYSDGFTVDYNGTNFNYVFNNGNIGIGTYSPAYNLHICSSSGNTILGVQDTCAGGAARLYLVNASRSMFLTNNSSDCLLSLYYAGNNRLQFDLNNQWINTGCFGIGTTSPSVPLHVCTSGSQIARFTTTYSLSSGYADYVTLLASNQTGGGLSFNIGKAESSYNLGKLVFNYVGDQSTSNNLAFGFYNYDNKLVIVADGTVRPGANGTQNLGSASYRWCTIYTSDLSLSNGIGDYTIVEGESDLFLYNNKQCKVYKFMLQQVCIECAPAKMS